VKMFDHETAEVEVAVETEVVATVIFDHETAEVVETEIAADVVVEISEPEVIEEVAPPEVVDAIEDIITEAIEEIVETAVISADHPVHGMSRYEEVAEVEAPIEVPAMEETPAETTQTNVVSLFGRGRRASEVPEVTPEIVIPEIVVEVEEPAVAEIPVVEEKPVEKKPKATTGVDDIFAKLRAGSTAEVAAKVEVSEPAAKTEKPSKKKSKQDIIAADPARFAERDEALSGLVLLLKTQ
jgi:hypothetical protein